MTNKLYKFATTLAHIGKETIRWKEQFYLILALKAQIEYGTALCDHERFLENLVRAEIQSACACDGR